MAALRRNNNVNGERCRPALTTEHIEFWRYMEEVFNATTLVRTEVIEEMLHRCMRISRFLPKSKEQLWIECADKLTEACRYVIHFARPFFEGLDKEDQILLLVEGAFEVISIRMSRYIDPLTNCLVFDKMILPERAFYTMFMEEIDLVSSIFKFAKDIADLNLTAVELGIYSIIVLLNDERPGLRFRSEVKRRKMDMLHTFKLKLDYSDKQPLRNGMTVYDALIAKLPELRMINLMYVNAVAKFQRSHPHIKLPELHYEIFSYLIVPQSKL